MEGRHERMSLRGFGGEQALEPGADLLLEEGEEAQLEEAEAAVVGGGYGGW